MNQVDLRELAVRRDGPVYAPGRRKHVLSRYVLPGLLLAGFLGLLAWSLREGFLPRRPVTVLPVQVRQGTISVQGTPLFQAAGWVEPRPTPILVSALAESTVEKLLVKEDDEVAAGQPVAILVKDDAALALKAAQGDLDLRQAELASARARLAAAKIYHEKPLQTLAELGEAEAALARAELELTVLPTRIAAAEAELVLTRKELETRRKLIGTGAVGDLEMAKAQRDLDSALAGLDELKKRRPDLTQEVEGRRRRRDALQQRLDLKVEETRDLEENKAAVAAAQARVDQAQAAVDLAKLRLERMVVRADRPGRVLSLSARPGTRLMGMAPMSRQESSEVVKMYDPQSLQVRVDVRFEDVPKVVPHQKVRIDCPALAKSTEGVVLFTTSIADIQKNTLQVKVELPNPPPQLRPDMLVQATFLAVGSDGGSTEQYRLLVPRQLVEKAEGGQRVWVADLARGTATARTIRTGLMGGELVEIVEGLRPGDRLIVGGREGLTEGTRIAIRGEDDTLGGKQ